MKVMVYGATSAIAQAAGRLLAESGDELILVGRSRAKLDAVAADLRIRGAPRVEVAEHDAADLAGFEALVARAEDALGPLDAVLVAHGSLGEQKAAERDFAAAQAELTTNMLSVVALLTPVANRMEARRAGVIAVLSSVAGDRGRQSNYVYGTAKAGVSTFLQGLRNRLHHVGVAVVTVKPGFVDTPMTAHLPKNALFASPERVGRDVVRAMRKRRDVVYSPWFWRPILFVLRHVPERIFKRLRL